MIFALERRGADRSGSTVGMPWVARATRATRGRPRTMHPILLTLALTLAFSSVATAQESASTAPADSTASAAAPQETPASATPAPVTNAPDPPAAVAPAPVTPSQAAPPAVKPAARPAVTPPASAPTGPATAPVLAAPHDLRDLTTWLEWKTRRHLIALPIEARLFYRRGLLARQAGQNEEGLRLVRGAAELDPFFVQPHLTLASWLLVGEPSQALLQYATVLELARQNFNLQLELAGNALLLLLQAIFVGLLLASIIVVVLRHEDLRHPWEEHLGRFVSPRSAHGWSWAFLILPFAAGFGAALPTLGFLGLLWPSLRLRERILFILFLAACVGIPLTRATIDRFSLPLSQERGPFFGVPTIANEPFDRARLDRLESLAVQYPDNPFVQFGLAWTARRGGDLALSEHAYRRTLQLWPQNDRLLNNLGNTLAMQGRADDAMKLYEQAVTTNPLNAAAHFNRSQIHTQRFEYAAATEALSKASALNFEMVKQYQSQSTEDGLLPLADQWLEPKTFWTALTVAPAGGTRSVSMPTGWRGHIETSGWGFSFAALLLAGLGFAYGAWQNRTLPLRVCSNCGTVVCRRCAQRRRELALCPQCAEVEERAETADFSRVLLLQYRARRLRSAHMVRTALAAVVPGFGLLAHRHVFTAVFLLGVTSLLLRNWFGLATPFAVDSRLALSGQEVPVAVLVASWVLIYLVSLAGYFSLVAKERERELALNAAQRGRITQSTRRVSALAA